MGCATTKEPSSEHAVTENASAFSNPYDIDPAAFQDDLDRMLDAHPDIDDFLASAPDDKCDCATGPRVSCNMLSSNLLNTIKKIFGWPR